MKVSYLKFSANYKQNILFPDCPINKSNKKVCCYKPKILILQFIYY